jgi:hypothetical protein
MPPRILYIAGYSRCGSTLVDMVLNSSVRIASTGELTYLHDEAAARARMCTCGAAYGDCARYGDWLATRPTGEGAMVRRVERRNALGKLLAGSVAAEDARAYRAYGQSLFRHIARQTGADIIVDSSKSARDAAGRPLALSRLAGLDVRILHLTRDPRQTVQSYVERGSNWVLEGHRAKGVLESWRPILGWVLANRIARRIGHEIGADRYMHLRFEDFLSRSGHRAAPHRCVRRGRSGGQPSTGGRASIRFRPAIWSAATAHGCAADDHAPPPRRPACRGAMRCASTLSVAPSRGSSAMAEPPPARPLRVVMLINLFMPEVFAGGEQQCLRLSWRCWSTAWNPLS